LLIDVARYNRFTFLKVLAYGTDEYQLTRSRLSYIQLFSGDGYCLPYCAGASTSPGRIVSGSMTGSTCVRDSINSLYCISLHSSCAVNAFLMLSHSLLRCTLHYLTVLYRPPLCPHTLHRRG
jgi:hypothetical protein